MEVHLDADRRGLENLRRLLHGESPAPCVKHEYVRTEGTGIGFCGYCYSDDINDGNHFAPLAQG